MQQPSPHGPPYRTTCCLTALLHYLPPRRPAAPSAYAQWRSHALLGVVKLHHADQLVRYVRLLKVRAGLS